MERPTLTPEQKSKPLKMGDIEWLMDGIAPVMRDYVVKAVQPVIDRLVTLERHVLDLETCGVKYVGVYQRAADYKRGNIVTESGSAWVALSAVGPNEAPGKSENWQLMVKAGRDGKDARG